LSSFVAIAAALGAAASGALAAALQARCARQAREPLLGPTEGLLRFARTQLARGLWWVAFAIQAAGLAFHAGALSQGALSLVQPLLAATVVLALPLNHWLNGTSVTFRELLWAALLAVGLTAFLLDSAPSQPSGRLPSHQAAGVAAAAGLAAIAGCVVVARRSGPALAAACLGAASGIAFSGEAACLQVATTVVGSGPLALLSSPACYAVLAAGFAGVALTQLAYRAGPMSAALPAIITLNPLVSIVVGVAVLHETVRHTPGAVLIEIGSFAVLCFAVTKLTRHSLITPTVLAATPRGAP
jgi:drug/metabolite transporter (DMT)-like permease